LVNILFSAFLDHDDFGSKRSSPNVIDSKSLEWDAGGKTFVLFFLTRSQEPDNHEGKTTLEAVQPFELASTRHIARPAAQLVSDNCLASAAAFPQSDPRIRTSAVALTGNAEKVTHKS
jgi:hypothetical protein